MCASELGACHSNIHLVTFLYTALYARRAYFSRLFGISLRVSYLHNCPGKFILILREQIALICYDLQMLPQKINCSRNFGVETLIGSNFGAKN